MKLFNILVTCLPIFVIQTTADVDAIPSELLAWYFGHQIEVDAGITPREIFPSMVIKPGQKYLLWVDVVNQYKGSWIYNPSAADLSTTSPDDAAGQRVIASMSNKIRNDGKRNKLKIQNNINTKFQALWNAAPASNKPGGGAITKAMESSISTAIKNCPPSVTDEKMQKVLGFMQQIKAERATKIAPAWLDYLQKSLGSPQNTCLVTHPDGTLDADATNAKIDSKYASQGQGQAVANALKQQVLQATNTFGKFSSYSLNGVQIFGIVEHIRIIRRLQTSINQISGAIKVWERDVNWINSLPVGLCDP